MDTELRQLKRACDASPDDSVLAERFERQWLRSQALDLRSAVIDLNLVYEGDPMAGKATTIDSTLKALTKTLKPERLTLRDCVIHRGLIELSSDRFQHYPGLTVRALLQTVSGVAYNSHATQQLRRAPDGFFFVFGKQKTHLEGDLDAYQDLEESLKKTECRHSPVLMLRNPLWPDEDGLYSFSKQQLSKSLNCQYPIMDINAYTGEGVVEAFETMLDMIVGHPMQRVQLISKNLLGKPAFEPAPPPKPRGPRPRGLFQWLWQRLITG